MAGVKGKSGGARAGAGRKKNPENEGAEFVGSTEGLTPLDALEFLAHHEAVPVALRIKALGLAAPFRHKKLGEGGKPAPDADKLATPSKYETRTRPGATQH